MATSHYGDITGMSRRLKFSKFALMVVWEKYPSVTTDNKETENVPSTFIRGTKHHKDNQLQSQELNSSIFK